MQLIQPYVQKSRMTTLPLSSLSESGLPVFTQSRPGSKSGAFVDAGNLNRPIGEPPNTKALLTEIAVLKGPP